MYDCWLVLDTEVYTGLSDVIENTYLLKDIRQLSPLHQISPLETFHNHDISFAHQSTLPSHTLACEEGMHILELLHIVNLQFKFSYALHPVPVLVNLHVVPEENYFRIVSETHRGSA